MLNELVLTEEEIRHFRAGYKDRIDFNEGASISARLPVKDILGNPIGFAEVRLRDFQYIGSGRTSAEYEVLKVDEN